MRKVLILFGSPRKNGNTHLLVEETIRGLNDSNIESKVYYLNDMEISGCQACYFCKRNDTTKCIVDDDMQKIYKEMEAADGIIVAAPIYFHDVSAQTRLWLDRLFSYYDIKSKSGFPGGKRVAFILTQNIPNPEAFKVQIESFKYNVCALGLEKKGDLLVTDLDKCYKKMVVKNAGAMEDAYDIGRNFFKD